MQNAEIYEKLTEIFRDVFDDAELTIGAGTTADDVEDWDSLTHITLLSAIEEEFGIRFDMKAVHGLKNVGEMVALIGTLL